MDNEIIGLLNLNYNQVVDFLLKKYGCARYNYFCNEKCALNIVNNFEEYIYILQYFIRISKIDEKDDKNMKFKKLFGVKNIENICKDYSGKIVPIILERLNNTLEER